MKGQGSIRTKLMRLVLGVSFSALILLAAVVAINVFSLRKSTMGANGELSREVTQNSDTALQALMEQNLLVTTKGTAETAEEKLVGLQHYSRILANMATDIFSNPENYTSADINPPQEENDGKLALQYIYRNDIPEEQKQRAEADARLAANAGRYQLEMVQVDDAVTGCYISFETSLHVVADETSKSRVGNTKNYDPTQRAWYTAAKERNETTFSDVFDDSQGRGLSISCATPFYGKNGELLGVVGVGALLNDINDLVLSTQIGKTGRMFVLNEVGQVIISRDIQRDEKGGIIREDLLQHPTLGMVAKRMIAGQSGVERVDVNGTPSLVAFYPLNSTGWSIAAIVDAEEALAASRQSEAAIQAEAEKAILAIDKSILLVGISLGIVLIVALVLIAIFSERFAKKLTKPLLTLSEGAGIIAQGDLDYTIEIKTNDEIEGLATAFNEMTHRLKTYISDLTSVTAEKERIGTELNVATQIQASMLPSIFPAFPERSDVDIYATMHPAKEVGGDFYDFFLVDDNHLAVVMADVSGKGVPAALFMVIAKTIIKNHTQNNLSAAEVFTIANHQLCENNDACLFVTAWMGILNLTTGDLSYVNAGHNAPALMHSGQCYKYLPSKAGFVLAGIDGIKYEQCEMKLMPGDVLYLYTDGVTEATSEHVELYGDDRLLEVLNRSRDLSLSDLLPTVRSDIDRFVGAAPQFDDITMLGLKFLGK